MSFPLFIGSVLSIKADLEDLEETFDVDPFVVFVVLLLLIESLLPDLLFCFDDFLRDERKEARTTNN